jgi:hypothetical protein
MTNEFKLFSNLFSWIIRKDLYEFHVAAAVIGGAVVSGVVQSSAASDAAGAQTAAANQANATQQGMFNTTQKNLSPYYTQGAGAIKGLNDKLANGTLGGNFTNADLNAYMAPNYAFQLQQGQQALQNSQAADSGVLSGAALKGMQNFTQNTAAGAYQQAYANWLSNQNLNYGQLMGIASLGENAAAMMGNNATQTGQSIAQNMIGAGNAQAAGTIGSANALSGAIGSATGYMGLNNMLGGGNLGDLFGGGGTSTASLDSSQISSLAGGTPFMSGGAYGFGG